MKNRPTVLNLRADRKRLSALMAAAAVTLMLFGAAPALAEGAAERSEATESTQSSKSKAAVVNVNEASAEQLQLLPRVGPSIALRILEFREQNGPFKRLDDLMLVRGIGEKTFLLIKPHVALSGATSLSSKVRTPRPASEGDAS